MIKSASNLIEKASQQILSDVLGYDEGRMYVLILTKKSGEVDKEFSYSKKYRVMKSLFEKGALAKIKPEGKDFFSYVILPPSFLYASKIDEGIIRYLEEIYLKNFGYVLNAKFSQIILKNERGLVIFMLKYFMKNDAEIHGSDLNLKKIQDIKHEKVIFKNGVNGKRIGMIDRKVAFELSEIRNSKDIDFVGYLSNGEVEKEIEFVR